MPNGCCPSGSIIILLLSGKGQLAPKAGGLTFPAVVSSFPSSLAGTEISKVLLSSPCLSLSPGTCAFAEFHFTSFHFISFHFTATVRGEAEGKAAKGIRTAPGEANWLTGHFSCRCTLAFAKHGSFAALLQITAWIWYCGYQHCCGLLLLLCICGQL